MTNMIQSSMGLFKRKKKEPISQHIAFLHIENDHFQISETHDLSDLTYESLNAVLQFIEDMHFMQEVEAPADFEYVPEDDEDE